MRPVTVLALACLAFSSAQGAALAQEKVGPKLRIAVMESSWDPGLFEATGTFGAAGYTYNESLENYAQGLTEMMVTELVNSGRFVVVERQAIHDVQLRRERPVG
jgi:curli biogenesis system outer membrane secretion channel CsgG